MNDFKTPDVDILVADDEPHIIHALNFIFKKEGYRVKMAFDGVSALQLIKEQKPRTVSRPDNAEEKRR
jgi:two-component system alkaline phosphatase synthesis response regulator PhoP